MTIGVMEALKERGLRVPDDIALVGVRRLRVGRVLLAAADGHRPAAGRAGRAGGVAAALAAGGPDARAADDPPARDVRAPGLLRLLSGSRSDRRCGCMPPLMSQVDKLQEAEEHVAQMREETERAERSALTEDLRRSPRRRHRRSRRIASSTRPARQVRTMANMREGALPDLHELAVSIKETGLLHPPLVRETGDDDVPYELLAGRRRFGAMQLLDEAEGARSEWRFTVVEGISRREALTMQFAENFHQSKPEPVAFARAARRIMAEDESLTAAEVSRLVGAPASWTRKALRLLELPESIVERVEAGDLSFTSADLVRRGIARGDVSADDAASLVEQHASGLAQRRGAQARRRLRPAAAGELRRAVARPGRGALPPVARSRRAQRRPRPRLRARPRRPSACVPRRTRRTAARAGWSPRSSTPTCSASSSPARRPTTAARSCASTPRPTRTPTRSRSARPSASPRCGRWRPRSSPTTRPPRPSTARAA